MAIPPGPVGVPFDDPSAHGRISGSYRTCAPPLTRGCSTKMPVEWGISRRFVKIPHDIEEGFDRNQ